MDQLFNELVAKDMKDLVGCDNMSAILIDLFWYYYFVLNTQKSFNSLTTRPISPMRFRRVWLRGSCKDFLCRGYGLLSIWRRRLHRGKSTEHFWDEFSKERTILSYGWIAVCLNQPDIELSIDKEIETENLEALPFNSFLIRAQCCLNRYPYDFLHIFKNFIVWLCVILAH